MLLTFRFNTILAVRNLKISCQHWIDLQVNFRGCPCAADIGFRGLSHIFFLSAYLNLLSVHQNLLSGLHRWCLSLLERVLKCKFRLQGVLPDRTIPGDSVWILALSTFESELKSVSRRVSIVFFNLSQKSLPLLVADSCSIE